MNSEPVVLIPSWEQPVVGNLSDKLGAFWELVIGSDASAGSLGIGWELGSQKKLAWEGGSQKNGSHKTAGIPLGCQ